MSNPLPSNVCLTGGALGADSAFEMYADYNGHKVISWSFVGHRNRSSRNIIELPQEELNLADPYLTHANKTIQRKFPTSNWHTNNLLRRNYYQVESSTAFYGVGVLKHGIVQGGTAWAFTMFVDLHAGIHPVYFFDQTAGKWLEWVDSKWVSITEPPAPNGVYTGVGSRDLTPDGISAIEYLYKDMRWF